MGTEAADPGSPAPATGQPANSGPAVDTKSGTTTKPARRRTARPLAVTGTGPDGTTVPTERPAATESSITPGLDPTTSTSAGTPKTSHALPGASASCEISAVPCSAHADATVASSKPSAEVAVPSAVEMATT